MSKVLCPTLDMNLDLNGKPIIVLQQPQQLQMASQQPTTTKIVNKQTKFGSILIGLIFVFGLGVLLVYFLYKGKKTKAKQRKNDQKYTLKSASQNDKIGTKASQRDTKTTKQNTKNRKNAKPPPTKGGNTVNLKRA